MWTSCENNYADEQEEFCSTPPGSADMFVYDHRFHRRLFMFDPFRVDGNVGCYLPTGFTGSEHFGVHVDPLRGSKMGVLGYPYYWGNCLWMEWIKLLYKGEATPFENEQQKRAGNTTPEGLNMNSRKETKKIQPWKGWITSVMLTFHNQRSGKTLSFQEEMEELFRDREIPDSTLSESVVMLDAIYPPVFTGSEHFGVCVNSPGKSCRNLSVKGKRLVRPLQGRGYRLLLSTGFTGGYSC